MDFKIDWLTLTLKPDNKTACYTTLKFIDDMNELENWCFGFLKLHREKQSFKVRQGMIQHYNVMYSYNCIDIALSSPERIAEQGIMFRFSADGIAFYEKFRKNADSSWNWIKFLQEFFSLGAYGFTCKCTRIDLAFDDISYDENHLIDLKIVEKALARGEFVSMFRKDSPDKPLYQLEARQKLDRKKGSVIGNTIYLGNRKSKVFLRFYDKLAECIAKKEPYDDNIKHWVRMEFEFKDTRAMCVCDSLLLLTAEEFANYMSKVTNSYVRFIVPKGDVKHYYRCSSRKWWIKVVGTIEKARLQENKAYRNKFVASMKWLRKQVFPSIYAILHCLSVDEFLTDVYDSGISRFEKYGDNSEQIIKDYINNPASEILKGIDIHRVSSSNFEEIVKTLESKAFSTAMRQQGYKLCETLDMMNDYKNFVNVYVERMYNKQIIDFKTKASFEAEILEEKFPCTYYDVV